VLTLHDLRSRVPREVRHFAGSARTEFSAVTIYVGRYERVIVTNPFHAPTRRMSSVCHEISHIVLEHEAEGPQPFSGGRAWNGTQEREADWLAGCLLIPLAATRAAARDGRSDVTVADMYGVSQELAAWRMNATGARILAKRQARFRKYRGAGGE
jgi:Zn-dependent peptidase ImmA (M78 family)